VRDADGTSWTPRRARRGRHRAVELAEKEGLALINGTDGMLGMLCLAIADLRALLVTARTSPRR
jgi:histidine ammonia-lyase